MSSDKDENVKYFDVDSTYRNRNNYPDPYDFVIPFSNSNKGSTASTFVDPILDSAPFTGSSTLQPGQLLLQTPVDPTHIKLDAVDSDIPNYYINMTLQVGTEFSLILSYDGISKVATIDQPYTTLPTAGTVYYTRMAQGYLNSDVSIARLNSVNGTVDQLNLLTAAPSPIRDFYSGSYIRFTNGPHISKTALITQYDPTGSIISWNQNVSDGVNEYVNTSFDFETEQGFSFIPTVSGIFNSLTLNLTAFESTLPNRSLLITLKSGSGLGGSVLYTSPPFNVINTATPTDTTFSISSGPALTVGQQYTVTLLDTTATGLSSGYINIFGITPAPGYNVYNSIVYPKTSINLLSGSVNVYDQTSNLNLILDNVSTSAQAAYSLRKLRSAYSGYAIRVRRSSDNTTQDIGFVNNSLDIVSLKTFVGGGSGYIRTWYDQSTNGNNCTQTTDSFQPRIVNSGTIDNFNGIPVITFDGVDNFMSMTSYPFSASGTCSVNLACKLNASSNTARFFDLGNSTSMYFLGMPTNGSNGRFELSTGSIQGTNFTAVTDTVNDHVYTFNHTGTTMEVYKDRTSQGSQAGITLLPSDISGSNNYIGKSQNVAHSYLSGSYQEMIFFGASLNINDQLAVEYDQKSYYSTP